MSARKAAVTSPATAHSLIHARPTPCNAAPRISCGLSIGHEDADNLIADFHRELLEPERVLNLTRA